MTIKLGPIFQFCDAPLKEIAVVGAFSMKLLAMIPLVAVAVVPVAVAVNPVAAAVVSATVVQLTEIYLLH